MASLTSPPPQSRTLILCFDGTTNIYDASNTSVVNFFSLLQKDDPSQLVYYQPGIGTYVSPGMWAPILLQVSKLADTAVAWYLDAHIMGGYKFLMAHYQKGDRVCLFGFSRGAYTARALAGMLQKVGLLPNSNQEQVPFAYSLYKNCTKKGVTESQGFKNAFCRSLDIEFVGVWDTVSSVGFLVTRHLPFTGSNSIIKTFRHALALDERRIRYKANLWHTMPSDTLPVSRDPERASDLPIDVGMVDSSANRRESDVEEVWFPGCHTDVGGGAVDNSLPHSLAFPPLRWMIEQTILCQTGIKYNTSAIESIGLHPSPFRENQRHSASTHTTLTNGFGSKSDPAEKTSPNHSHHCDARDKIQEHQVADEEDAIRETHDAAAPIHDRLKGPSLWWLLEVVPMFHKYQDEKGNWHRRIAPNLGRGRRIYQPDHPKYHPTVKTREEAGIGYKPKAKAYGDPCYLSY